GEVVAAGTPEEVARVESSITGRYLRKKLGRHAPAAGAQRGAERAGGAGVWGSRRMRDEILTYWEMCAREKGSLQRGMYFKEPPAVSVVLMSRRRGAPYEDELSDDGTELVYEGHDVRK